MLQHTVEEVVAIGLRARAPIGPVLSSLDLLDDAHLAARGFLRDVRIGDRVLRYPRGPFLIEGREPRLAPPPELDEANRRGLDWAPRDEDRAGRPLLREDAVHRVRRRRDDGGF